MPHLTVRPILPKLDEIHSPSVLHTIRSNENFSKQCSLLHNWYNAIAETNQPFVGSCRNWAQSIAITTKGLYTSTKRNILILSSRYPRLLPLTTAVSLYTSDERNVQLQPHLIITAMKPRSMQSCRSCPSLPQLYLWLYTTTDSDAEPHFTVLQQQGCIHLTLLIVARSSTRLCKPAKWCISTYLPAVFRQIKVLWSLTVSPDEGLAPSHKATLHNKCRRTT